VVSLQGVNTDIFWQRIREFRDLFEGWADIESLSLQLEKFSQSLAEIRDIWHALFVFIGLTLVIMMMLLVAIFRYHLRLFIDERTVGRLVGADPIFIWWPHVVTSIIYLTLSISVSIWLFFLLQYIF
jgi:cell division protein FtsX